MKCSTEQSQSAARSLRVSALANFVIAIAVVAVVLNRGQWLPGRGWTILLLVAAASALTTAPYLWTIAEYGLTKRTLRWASVLSGALDFVLGAGAATLAITNQRNHWIGDSVWTIALAALALLSLLGALSHLVRARG